MVPILLPIAHQPGMGLIHLGIVVVANLTFGLLTPPVGRSLFVGCRIAAAAHARAMSAGLGLSIASRGRCGPDRGALQDLARSRHVEQPLRELLDSIELEVRDVTNQRECDPRPAA